MLFVIFIRQYQTRKYLKPLQNFHIVIMQRFPNTIIHF